MTIDLGNGKCVLSMTLVDLSTGNEQTLFEREGSRCHFNDDVYFQNYIITLRIDWGDLQNEDPVLDADIYENVSGRKGKKLKNGPWHHTLKEFDQGENRKIYCFSFQSLRLSLGARMTFGLSAKIDAILVGSKHDDTEA